MRPFRFTHTALLIVILLAASATHAAPPVVVKITPTNGDKNVDPKTSWIKVVFDQNMNTRGYSVCGGGDAFPPILGRPRWINKRQFVVRVRLKPNHQYQLSINCPSAMNFRSAAGESVNPYPVTFTTGAGDAPTKQGADQLTPQINNEATDILREMIDRKYSYRDRMKLDWDALFETYRPMLSKAKSSRQFAAIAAALLIGAQDKHISLSANGQRTPTFVRPMTPNANAQLLPQLVPNWRRHNPIIYTGRFEDGVLYARIDSWSTQDPRAYEAVYQLFGKHPDAPGLIIDVRFNGGGSETLAQDLAGCFIDQSVMYAKHVYRDETSPTGFTPAQQRAVEPNPGRPRYRGKIAVLSGPVVFSSCEAFVLMMKQTPYATVFGDATQGGSGNPQAYNLGNGVTVFLPSWKAMTPDGKEFEGVGIEPDVKVQATRADFAQRDPVLAAARKHLRR